MNINLLTILSHIINQITSKWISPMYIFENNKNLENIDINMKDEIYHDKIFWIKYIEDILKNNELNIDWLRIYLDMNYDNKNILINTIVDHLKWCKYNKADYIDFFNNYYPDLLRSIDNPPLALTMLGNKKLLDYPSAGVVGARKASAFSYKTSYKLGSILADSGFSVVSGGAIGCDIAAHLGALRETDTPAIVVFAGGLDKLYPKYNLDTFNKIYNSNGLFISEKIWNANTLPYYFPIRNRIISGLVEHLYIIQTTEKSGTMITAKLALSQGRQVFVLKHPDKDIKAFGNDLLIEEGLDYFTNLDDIKMIDDL